MPSFWVFALALKCWPSSLFTTGAIRRRGGSRATHGICSGGGWRRGARWCAALPTLGMTLVEAAAPRSVDVGSAARSLIGKVDVIYTNTDNNVVSAYEALVKVGQEAKIPLIASDTDSVKRGAIAAFGINYRDLGEQTGRIVVRILNGEKPGDIKPEVSTKMELFVNPGAAEKQGVKLSDALIKSAAQVVQ